MLRSWSRARAALVVVGVVVIQAGLTSIAFAETGDIIVGGVWVCRLTKGVLGLTLAQRVTQVEQRIADVLSIPERKRRQISVEVRPVGSAAEIVAADLTIFTVTPDDAAGTDVRPHELANQWAGRLAEGLRRALPGREVVTQVNVLPIKIRAGETGGLVGTIWYWEYTQMKDGSGFMPGDRRKYTVQFSEHGSVEVRANCNSAGGSYVLRDRAILISVTQIAGAACSPASLERQFLADLGEVAKYSLGGGLLLLELKRGVGMMRFTQEVR